MVMDSGRHFSGLFAALKRLAAHDPGHDPNALLSGALLRADSPADLEQIAQAALDFAARDAARAAIERLGGLRAAPLRARFARMWDITDLPGATDPLPDPVPGRIACVLYSSLPWLSTGYAVRSQALARALMQTGADVQCITRPGFPWDESPEILSRPAPDPIGSTDHVDTIPYHRLPRPVIGTWEGYADYISQATDTLVACLRDVRPSVVMAASNHICALPALRAARILGLPMAYDMRGMWELSRAAREPGFMASPQFCYERALETGVAKGADHVFALSPPMRAAMIRRGVAPARITYLPNGCDPAPPGPSGSNAALRARLQIPRDVPVIGYVGSFPAYEGLEDLISAAARLKVRGYSFRLVLVGDESGTGQHGMPRGEVLMNLAQTLDVADRVILTGRIDADTVRGFLEMSDMMVVPRRPLAVTEMVAPLKPAEAMAAGRAVIVSSVGGMAGLVEDGRTGLVFRAGDDAALADAIARLLEDPALGARLGHAAALAAKQRFSWDSVARRMTEILGTCATGVTGP